MPLTYGLEPFTALALSGGVMGAYPWRLNYGDSVEHAGLGTQRCNGD